jgi:hypothetical protein
VRSETRVEIGGKEADEGTVQLLANLLSPKTWPTFRQRFKQFCLRNTPETWGIVVTLAKEIASQSPRLDHFAQKSGLHHAGDALDRSERRVG